MQEPTAADKNDVTINALALHHAAAKKSAQSVLKNFLPDTGDDKDAGATDSYGLEDDKDESEIETYNESGGVGYVPPSDETASSGAGASDARKRSAATELLRKQMLGKRAFNRTTTVSGSTTKLGSGHLHASKPRPHNRRSRKEEFSDDEDEGRSKVGKKNRATAPASKDLQSTKSKPEGDTSIDESKEVSPAQTASMSGKRGTSYLDQVLAQRAAKKHKKKQKQNSTSQT